MPLCHFKYKLPPDFSFLLHVKERTLRTVEADVEIMLERTY